jgi:hypothetical protein
LRPGPGRSHSYAHGANIHGDLLLSLSGGGTIELNGTVAGSLAPGFVA